MSLLAHAGAPADIALWPVVLSGGSGTRLWPLSRSLHPKQLLPIAEELSMLQATVGRIEAIGGAGPAIVIGGEEHRFLIADQLATTGMPDSAILLEPEGRNTAAAIAIVAHWLHSQGEDAPMLVMPSDHVIADLPAFGHAVTAGLAAAAGDALVTFGINPEHPETGFGYIEVGGLVDGMTGAHNVARFVEKPDAETAAAYVAGGRHLWNCGIFLFRPSVYLAALATHAPAIAVACADASAGMAVDGRFVRPAKAAFLAAPAESIDYAVMEHTDRAVVVPVTMGWSDVGSWNALWEIETRDVNDNALRGDVVAVDSEGCLLRNVDGPMIATVGIRDLVVVSTKDSILIVPRDRAQDVRKIVDELKRRRSNRPHVHAVVHRPWGTYETTDAGERFQTKRIVVKPGGLLSLQMHHHRAEHWIVVSGTAKVTIDSVEKLVHENESAYIPIGASHRLENPGKIPLHLIEVQCGPYLGEDDIVRFEDVYARA